MVLTRLRWRQPRAARVTEYVIDGAKRWIGNGSLADVVVVWARDAADGQVKGFLVERGTPGYQARVIDGKGSVRAVWQAHIELRRRAGAGQRPAARDKDVQGHRQGAGLDAADAARSRPSATPSAPTTRR